ncbi:MAG: hypothetical protein ACRCW4_11325 [Candidatus Neomicrothrix subdominans]
MANLVRIGGFTSSLRFHLGLCHSESHDSSGDLLYIRYGPQLTTNRDPAIPTTKARTTYPFLILVFLPIFGHSE